ncbi:MAG: ATP-binding cassette domain-containing protein [Tepidisphaeraceae bacterium]
MHTEAPRVAAKLASRDPADRAPLLRAQNVHRFLGTGEARTQILKGVNLTIERSEYVSIVGASGSGKSTLLYLLGGLDRPDRKDENDQAIARALANEPAVLLADEPTGNLDRKNGELVADIFQQLAARGQTIVMVTHDQQLAHKARRMVTMDDGNVIGDEALAPDARRRPITHV